MRGGEQKPEGHRGAPGEGPPVLRRGQRSVPRYDGEVLRAIRGIQASPRTTPPPLPGPPFSSSFPPVLKEIFGSILMESRFFLIFEIYLFILMFGIEV